MAGKGRPGPKPGSGGRPRLGKATKPDPAGYKRMTVGKPGAGHLEYVHDVVAGLVNPGRKGKVVDHISGKRSQDTPSNLRVTSRSVNAKNRHPSLTPRPKRKGK